MKTRIISAIFGLPIVIIPLILGGNVLSSILFIASLIGLNEFFKAFKIRVVGLKVVGYIGACLYYYIILFNEGMYLQEFFSIFFIILLVYYVKLYPNYNLKEIMVILLGFFYVIYMLSHIILIRNMQLYGQWTIWLVFIVAFGSDSAAYFIGCRYGKNKLAEKLSPKKTIEGSIGGIFGAIILSLVYGIILIKIDAVSDGIILPIFCMIGFFGSILAQIGDLVASAIKRQTGIKDFGKIMPGHGGILDRLDSIIFTAPFVYYIMKFFIL